MKFIIFGLGDYGSVLSTRLTSLGQEVIGVDADSLKTEILKDVVSQTICLDSTNEQALATLPIRDCDYAIVAIGEDFASSVKTTALLKQAGVKYLASRAINPLHRKVLETLGVDRILHPENESASRFADSILLPEFINSFDISGDYKVVELRLNERYAGMLVSEVNLKERYSLILLTIIRAEKTKSIFGHDKKIKKAIGILTEDQKLEKGDHVVLFGRLKDLDNFVRKEDI
jgi:trk system potassium uptake protein